VEGDAWARNRFEASVGLRQAALAMAMTKKSQQDRLVRRLVRKTQNGTLGKDTTEPEDEEDDTVHIGDIGDINIYGQLPENDVTSPAAAPTAPAATSQPVASTVPSAAAAKNGWNWKHITAIAALAGLGGAGLGALPWLMSDDTSQPAFTDTDTWSEYDVQKWTPLPPEK